MFSQASGASAALGRGRAAAPWQRANEGSCPPRLVDSAATGPHDSGARPERTIRLMSRALTSRSWPRARSAAAAGVVLGKLVADGVL